MKKLGYASKHLFTTFDYLLIWGWQVQVMSDAILVYLQNSFKNSLLNLTSLSLTITLRTLIDYINIGKDVQFFVGFNL